MCDWWWKMASRVFDFKELDDFSRTLLNNASTTMPKETRKFLNKQGYALRKKTRETSKKLVQKKTGAYHKGWRKGKVYRYKGDKTNLAVRVYNATPGAGAIEIGRTYKKKDGSEWFMPGKHVMETAAKEFEGDYSEALDDFMDELVDLI